MNLLLALLNVALVIAALAVPTTAQDGSYYTNSSGDSVGGPSRPANSTVPKGTKTYVASLRVNATHNNFCAATLISPKHLLTGGACIGGDIRYASIGSHYNNGTEDGEQIKVVAILSHPNISENSLYSYDFVVLELQKPSSFKPIPLAAADGSDIKDGEVVTKLGWYNTGGVGQIAHELQRADVELMSNEECAKRTFVDDTIMCSRPVGDTTSCTGDYGGPLIVERPEGDVLVGVISAGDDCKKAMYPSYYSRIPEGRDWIESIGRGSCYY
ncbi:unnamed protein product [Phytophthora fragariaefolia]|uniref:Unnamed protein product n=1 Tax=Phytophthora fragariaefolia TaxID=1490495 RepID=A0A9W6XCN8_9STRA|nr:unnamed protein product [Phytophthora fragariaefolia]